MAITPEIEAEILRAYNLNPKRTSPFRIARDVGATTGEVIGVLKRNQEPGTYTGDVTRVELVPFIVASRRATEAGWDNTDEAIIRARAAYEAGTHDMATHREGPWLHLCSIPVHRKRRARPGYFS